MNAPDTPTLAIDARLANEDEHAGVGTFCTELLRALPPVLGGWRLLLYLDAPPKPHFPLGPDDATIRVLPRAPLWTQRALPAALATDKPDVFFSPVTNLPFRCPCRAIVMIMDLAYVSFPAHFTLRQRFQNRLQTWWAVRRADRLLALSEATRADLERLYRVPPARVGVTLAGPAPRFAQRPAPDAIAAVRAELKLPEHFVLYVGRLQPRKNIARLIEAFAQVCQRHPGLQHQLLITGGKGWLFEGIFQAAHVSPVVDRVRFLGYVPDEALPPLVAAADVLALVSLWEGFGLPVIEAMACGTAVLTSNCSSLPEVAGDAAALADPYSIDDIAAKLERLLLDDAYRADLAARGPAQAAKFTWADVATRVIEAVDSVHRSR